MAQQNNERKEWLAIAKWFNQMEDVDLSQEGNYII